MSELERRRKEGCLSDLAVDRLLRNELDEPAAVAARSHAASCELCRARVGEVESLRATFQAAPPPLRRPRPRRRWARALMGAGAGLAAAAVLVILWRDDEGTRLKGGRSVSFYVQHNDQLRLGHSGERVAPGDYVQLVYSGAAPLYGAILSVDGAHHVSRYFPDDTRAAALPPGQAQRFPRSTQLDDVLGHESLYALLCPEALPLEPLQAALAADLRLDAPGCLVARIELDKQLP
jgi:hypothetical protein